MYLHENKELFEDLIIQTAESFGIPEDQVEKDYYVSFLLEHLVREVPNLVFKGGTSLSKCYGVIKRFSEDIDINYAAGTVPTQSQRKEFKEAIVRAINSSGLTFENPLDVRSKRDHNIYEVSFDNIIGASGKIKKELLVETYVPIKIYPTEPRAVSSYILEFLKSEGQDEMIATYQINEFIVNVQHIHRTFIDKIFAICDYHEQQKHVRNSRHLYDIHKMFGLLQIEKDDFTKLFEEVRAERQRKPEINISSHPDYDLVHNLRSILNENTYEDDYNGITKSLLFEEVEYKEVKETLEQLLNLDLIPCQ